MNPIIFCDFDGTITESDNIILIMEKFASVEANEIKNAILNEDLSIQEGVKQLFSLLPSSLKDEIISYVLENAKIRDGFNEFISFTQKHEIPLYIVSGGIDFFLHPVLEPYGPFENIFCNHADFSGEKINIVYPYSCDDICSSQGCGCCKPSIIRSFSDKDMETIVIGDSITDLQAAKLAHHVFARDFLIKKCEQYDIPYQSFHNFYDIINKLEEMIEVKI
ncbi:2-hydroxy-3-keto-5-methylthiopentenyl-1-phosphate phosphatase [Bacillus mesophilum]|uniref:2-hydroxy-3-keto-5-methylthiopentenyl-1- phosphate phosphatase n=1 Tax=Bacillus mesophilum TaxID=1071718 RepID=UPI0018652595